MDLFRIFMAAATCCYIGVFLYSMKKYADFDVGDVLGVLCLAVLVVLPLVGVGGAINGTDFFSKDNWLVYGIMLVVMMLLFLLTAMDAESQKRTDKERDAYDDQINKVNQSISEMTQRLSDMESALRQLKQDHTKSDIDAIWGKGSKGR